MLIYTIIKHNMSSIILLYLKDFLISFIMMLTKSLFTLKGSSGREKSMKRHIANMKLSAEPFNIHDILMVECPSLYQQFRPLEWAKHPFIQSTLLYCAHHVIEDNYNDTNDCFSCDRLLNSKVYVQRDIIHTNSGGSLALDWVTREAIHNSDEAKHVLLHFPGLGSCEPTIGFGAMVVSAMQEHCLQRNISTRVGCVVYPGFAGHTLNSHKLPGSAYVSTDDVGEVLRHVHARYPKDELILVGCSMGSALLSNWLVRNPEEAGKLNIKLVMMYAYGHSTEAAVFAADNDMFGGASGASAVRMWKNVILGDPSNMKHIMRLERTCPGFNVSALRSATTVREWDEACLPAYGFKTMSEMFSMADPVNLFHHMNTSIPVVIINADDDWLCPSHRLNDASTIYGCMRNVAIIETKGGGHLGWVDCLDLHKNTHLNHRWPLQILHIAKAIYGLSSDEIVEDTKTGGHCRWLMTASNQVIDATIADKLSVLYTANE